MLCIQEGVPRGYLLKVLGIIEHNILLAKQLDEVNKLYTIAVNSTENIFPTKHNDKQCPDIRKRCRPMCATDISIMKSLFQQC